MKFLHSWLQDYIEEKIPSGEEFVKAINECAFEVEAWEKLENKLDGSEDYLYELDILPNRAHDALGHYYLAREIATIFNLTFLPVNLEKSITDLKLAIKKSSEDFIKIAEPKKCSRFLGCEVSVVEVAESPELIKYRLEAIGQKSINNLVDITNYVQFAYNKPMHAYDKNLVSEFLEARLAKAGETMTTLDGRMLELDEETLVIADRARVLSLAGIKGGKYSGVTTETSEIIIESANFQPSLIRKTSQKYKLQTDASKRFENGLADELSLIGMVETLKLLKKYGGEKVEFGEVVDNFPNEKAASWPYKVSVSLAEINSLLGLDLNERAAEDIFERLGFTYEYLSPREMIENLIPKVLGAKYKNPSSMRADAPRAFSCSSLISYLYAGIYMPSISIDKYLFTRDLGREIQSEKDLRFGDLVFINTGIVKETGIYHTGQEYKRGVEVEEGVDHLGMYVGEGKILHASSVLEKGTEIETLEKFLSRGKLVGYGRVLVDLSEKRFLVTIPSERLDLRIKQDLIEEVGRIYGLNQITAKLPNLNRSGVDTKKRLAEWRVREILTSLGFSEVITYSLRAKGEIRILKSVAKDKNYLRSNLTDGIQEAIEKNIFNLPVLSSEREILSAVKIYEFGKCFKKNTEELEQEWTSLAIGIDDGGKNKAYEKLREEILMKIKEALAVEKINFTETKNQKQKINIFEINFDELLANSKMDFTKTEIPTRNLLIKEEKTIFQPFAKTPFIVRDIAFWGSPDTDLKEVKELIRKNTTELVTKIYLFDEFEKDGKKSFAFRLIYQDPEQTLTDEEVNTEAEVIYKALKEAGFEIR